MHSLQRKTGHRLCRTSWGAFHSWSPRITSGYLYAFKCFQKVPSGSIRSPPVPGAPEQNPRREAAPSWVSELSYVSGLHNTPLAKVLACLWQWIIQKACCQQLSGTIFQAIQTYSFSFKGREKSLTMIRLFESRLPYSYCLSQTQCWRFAYFCVYEKSRSWQAMYLPERTMKDWHRKEIFFLAKVLVHHCLSCLFKFCFVVFKKSSTVWMWSVSLRAKKQNSAAVPHAEWVTRLGLRSQPEPHESCSHGVRQSGFQHIW